MVFEDVKALVRKGLSSLPEPELKKDWETEFDRMVVHSRGIPPCNLLNKAHPNENEEIRKYREDNYESITTGVFNKGFDNLYRALFESNYAINASDDLKEYLSELTINNHAFIQFMFKIMLRRKIEDPNGLLVVLPYGEGLLDNTVQVDVTLELVLSSQIRYFDKDFLMYKCQEKSMVKVPDGQSYKEVQEGDVYYIITDTQYLKYYQTDVKSKDIYTLEVYYNHDIGERPFVVLGGRPSGKIDKATGHEAFFFNSEFHAFVAHANEAIRDKSTHTGVKATCAYPIRVVQEEPCNNPRCVKGEIYDDDGKSKGKCKTCKGTGNLIPVSEYQAIVKQKKKKAPFTEGVTNEKAVEFITVDPSSIKLMGEESDNALLKAEKALQTVQIEMAQSGVAKEKDREDQYSMMYSFSDYFFEINLKKPIWFIQKLRDLTSKDPISITKPINFAIKNELTLQQEFTEANKNGSPDGMLIDIYFDLIKKRFSGDPVRLKMEEAALMYTPFYIYSTDKKNEMLLQNVITKDDYIKSIRVAGILWSIYTQNKDNFFAWTDEELVLEIDKRIAIFLPKPAPDLQLSLTEE